MLLTIEKTKDFHPKMAYTLDQSVIRILNPDGKTVGTGFVVAQDLAVTCAHVINAARPGANGLISIRFFQGDVKQVAQVLPERGSPADLDDIAFLGLTGLPKGVMPVRLARAGSSAAHPYTSLGFPDKSGPVAARRPTASINGIVPAAQQGRRPLLECKGEELYYGLSGAPILDLAFDRVVGMVTQSKELEHTQLIFAVTTDTLQHYASELSLDDPAALRPALVNLQSTIVVEAEVRDLETLPPEPGNPPYQGLNYFTQADAHHFFGRELLTAKLVNHLAGTSFLAVLGASGSGKSSLVRAGVLPALASGLRLADGSLPPANSARWAARVLAPGAHPALALAAALGSDGEDLIALAQALQSNPQTLELSTRRLLARNDQPHLLLVIDQFEEVFTQCRDEAERKAFLDALLAAAGSGKDGPVTVLLILRADFYAHLAHYDQLRECVAANQEFIGAMRREELYNAIVKPAALGNWKIQEGLVDQILDDIGSEPGALPLLSHALLETWNHRRGRILTLSAYRDSGGVRGAIAQTAEMVFTQRLTAEQQMIARLIFTKLVEVEEDARDTRRRVNFTELITRAADPLTIDAVLSILIDARLVTTGLAEPGEMKVIEVAHEALIREWPTLRQWLDENRAGLILHRHMTEAAEDWLRLERDPGALYRGARLKQAQAWADGNPNALSLDEGAFLAASQAAALAEAEQERQLRRTMLLRRLVYPALGVVMVGILAVLFYTSGLYIRFKTPATMNGIFNIAVAEFGMLADDGSIQPAPNGAGQLLSGWVANRLKSELGSDPNLLVWQDGEDLRRLNVTIGRVSGSSSQARIQAAQALAERLNAQMLIFGNIDTRQSPAQLVLEFWMAPQAGYDYADLRGPYQVGVPIPLADASRPGLEAQPEIDRQASTLAWLALGLTRMRFGQAQEALQSFLKAAAFSPDSEAVQFFIGRESLFLAGRDEAQRDAHTQAAQEAFEQAIQINPEDARAYIGLGSVFFYRAENQFFDLPQELSAAEAAKKLAPALETLNTAVENYTLVLGLPAEAKPPGIPVDLVAKQGIGTARQLTGNIQLASGQMDAARRSLEDAAAELKPLIEPLQEDGHERYLAQVYENLGNTYYLLGYLALSTRDTTSGRAYYDQSIHSLNKCLALGKTSTDRIVKEDIAENLCTPLRDEVQNRVTALEEGS